MCYKNYYGHLLDLHIGINIIRKMLTTKYFCHENPI